MEQVHVSADTKTPAKGVQPPGSSSMLALVSDSSPGKCGGSGCRQTSWRFSYPIDTGTHVCSLHTLPKGRVFPKPVLGPRGPLAWAAPAPRRNARRHSSRGPQASPLPGCSGRDAVLGSSHPLPPALPGSRRLRGQAGKAARTTESPRGPPSRVQPIGRSTHLGAGLPSAPAAPAAGRRPPTPGPGPAPRAPPWVPPPAAEALRS